MSADEQTLWWNFTGYLEPGEHIYIEFNVTVDWYMECVDAYTYNDVEGNAYCECIEDYLEPVWGYVFIWDPCEPR